MIEKEPLEEVPILRDGNVRKREGMECIEDELWLAVTDGQTGSLCSGFFRTEVFVIQFLVQGNITGEFNHQPFKMNAPCGMYIVPSHVLRLLDFSDDMQVFSLSYSESFRKDLNLNLTNSNFYYKAYVRPCGPMTEGPLGVCLHYWSLLKELAATPASASVRDTALHLVRSLVCYISGLYDSTFTEQYPFSRSEDIASRFLMLVDDHCNEHQSMDWYAKKLCLSPKYLANVVKQVTGQSAGDCIVERLVLHAKSMLLTTSLSIQHISDCLGFRNQSHFGTFFRRAEGVSPKKFREIYRNKMPGQE